MMPIRTVCTYTILAALLLLAFTGCSQSVSLPVWRPATMDLTGLRKVAVAEFQGEDDVTRNIRGQIIQRMEDGGLFTVVDPPSWEQVLPSDSKYLGSSIRTEDLVIAGKRLGVDAVLVGRVQRKANWGNATGALAFRFGDPEIAVVVDYQVIDVRSGAVRASDTAIRSFTGDLGSDSDTSEEAEFERLAMECAIEVSNAVMPHRDSLEVPLASATMGVGTSALREGNKLARDGKWAAAMERWQAAIRENPDNDKAYYNLGLSYEALGDYTSAKRNYQAALDKSDKSTYQDALTRCESAANNHRLAMIQIRQARQHNRTPTQFTRAATDRDGSPNVSRASRTEPLPRF